MGNDQDCSPEDKLLNGLLHKLLADGVKCRGGFVQDDDWGILPSKSLLAHSILAIRAFLIALLPTEP